MISSQHDAIVLPKKEGYRGNMHVLQIGFVFLFLQVMVDKDHK